MKIIKITSDPKNLTVSDSNVYFLLSKRVVLFDFQMKKLETDIGTLRQEIDEITDSESLELRAGQIKVQ